MSFTFRQIEIFVEAAVDGNFRKTADRLGISQPAISKQIRALEKSAGKTLFLRTRGAAATLSGEGQAMLAMAREMLAKQRQWNPAATGATPYRLKVVTGDYLLDTIFKPALPELFRRFPRVSLEFLVSNERSRIVEQIQSGRADLAIYTGGKPRPDLGDSEIIGVVPCSLYAAPHIARDLGGDVDAIGKAPFILPSTASTSSWVVGALQRVGINPKNIAARTQFGDVLAEMVRDGFGIGLLFNDHAHARFGDQIRRIPVEIEPAYRVMIIGEHAKSPIVQPCLNFLRQLSSLPMNFS